MATKYKQKYREIKGTTVLVFIILANWIVHTIELLQIINHATFPVGIEICGIMHRMTITSTYFSIFAGNGLGHQHQEIPD